MKRRGFVKATVGAVALFSSGCLGGGGNEEEQEVDNEPQGRFTVIRNSEAMSVEIVVEDPMNSDHAALSGDHTFDKSPVMTDIQEGSSLTLSAERGEIEESGSLEIFAIRGDVETTEKGGVTLLDSEPEEYTSIEDEEDNPFSYDFSDSVED
ncbi:MAG: hypothetical protein ACLFR5_06945 [Halobacteriales archaeon]